MSDLKQFQSLVDDGATITMSVFEDRHAAWAKQWEDCVRVRVEFGSASPPTVLHLTPAEFTGLDKSTKDKVRFAPSSPPA